MRLSSEQRDRIAHLRTQGSSVNDITVASRIYNDEHWLSDMFLGVAIGTASGLTVAFMHKDESNSRSSFRILSTFNGLRAELAF